MPHLSHTEKVVIESGQVWWEKELFSGRVDWKKLLNIPMPALTQEEQSFLSGPTEALCQLIDDWEIVQTHNMSPEIWEYLKKEGFFGLVIPKVLGGHGFSAVAHAAIVTKIATRSVSVAVNMMVPNSLGPAELLLHYGTEEQKNTYLPKLARGEEIPAFALTGPEAGSDASAITDSGVICHGSFEGKEVLGIRMNWDKRYITLAPLATLLGIAFRLHDPEHLLGNEEELGITLALVPTHLPGVDIGKRHLPMNLGFMNGPTRGQDVFIPLEYIIGGPKYAGKGWQMLMEVLSIGRSVSLPALSRACTKMSYRASGAYAKIRKQFKLPIARFEGVEEALTEIAGFAYLLESTHLLTLSALAQKICPATASAITKYHMTELARIVINHAMDIHGGHGIQMGPRNVLANIFQAIPLCITVEGANILTRNLIIFGQGVIRAHPYLFREIELLSSTPSKTDTAAFDGFLWKHIRFAMSNSIRCFWHGVTGARFVSVPPLMGLSPLMRQFSRMSAALAMLTDVYLLLLGGNLKRREHISARLGDLLSYLYMGSAVIQYASFHQEPDDEHYARWCLQWCLYQIQLACDALLHNAPWKIIGIMLSRWVFPWGRSYRPPKDTLGHELMSPMLSPSAFRDRITCNTYVGGAQELSFQLESAFLKIPRVEMLQKKSQNQEILLEEEMAFLDTFEKLRKEIIQVNEFSYDLDTILK